MREIPARNLSARLGLLAVVIATVCCGGSPWCRGAEETRWRSAFERIRREHAHRHVEVLADDTFEGREAGSRGGRAASVYLGYFIGAEWQGARRFAEGTIQSMQRTAESMTLKVSAPSEAFLVTSEIFYPLRWQAILDGRPAFTLEVNGLIRGVQIPAGQHELTFTYDRSDFDRGRYVSLGAFGVAVLMVAGALVAGRAEGKKKQDS